MQRLTQRGFHFYQGDEKWLARGFTYGTFRPNSFGSQYPEPAQLRKDFEAIQKIGANILRLYDMPDDQFATLAAEYGLRLLIDVPWPKHLDVYASEEMQTHSIELVREVIARIRKWPNLMGVLLGNEIPSDIVRWVGAGRVQKFLYRLFKEAKSQAPELLVGFANYPSTEYLRLDFFDFLGFNVYLHEPSTFRNYLVRLRHLYPEKPLILSELGMDSQEHGEAAQAILFQTHLPVAYEVGMAGAFIFAWTDEWHTGGYDINAWSFGIVDHERRPKVALETVGGIYSAPSQNGKSAPLPFMSVVIASYNGGRTLRQCLESLKKLNYPSFEVIVVDDGSTDHTAEILSDFPEITVVSQTNQGLSAARNAGIFAASGEIVAFTDSDCFVDPDWLMNIAHAMQEGKYAGMGGPNLTPIEEKMEPRCVSLAPGHATHVLINADEAEHVPGCNAAFRRDALLEIQGFDATFRQAGDDVDVIWRLQDIGHRIGFTTGAFVWHHRRPTFKAYLKQQMGYGKAEALLLQKHPHRFNDRGLSIWRGRIYSDGESTAIFQRPNINFGIFCSGGFQCIYERTGSSWLYLVTSFEWWLICCGFILIGLPFLMWPLLKVGLTGLGISIAISGLKAWRAWRKSDYPLSYFPMVWFLWMAQPLVRGAMRYLARWQREWPGSKFNRTSTASTATKRDLASTCVLEYWGEKGQPRLDYMNDLVDEMKRQQWIFSPGSGWETWDLAVIVSWWFKVHVTSAEENHGASKRLLRMRFTLLPTSLFIFVAAAGLLLCASAWYYNSIVSRLILISLLLGGWGLYHQAMKARRQVEKLVDTLAKKNGFIRMGTQAKQAAQAAHHMPEKIEPAPQVHYQNGSPKADVTKKESLP